MKLESVVLPVSAILILRPGIGARSFARRGGRMFRANIAFDDHPSGRRWAGRIDTVSVESVFAFITARDPASTRVLVRLQ